MAESIDPEITAHVADLAGAARRASRRLGLLSRAEKDAALLVVGVGPAYPAAAEPNYTRTAFRCLFATVTYTGRHGTCGADLDLAPG